MKANFAKFIRSAGLIAGTMLALSGARALGAETAQPAKALPADIFPTFETYIKVSGQAAAVTGSKSAFQSRMQQNAEGAVGIEDMFITKESEKGFIYEFKGRALLGAEDYLADFKMSKPEVGTFSAGYKSFRTYYDGVGGFFPLNKMFMPLTNADLAIDRAKFYVNATVALPNAPVFTFNYINELRNGQKDSTIWGDTSQTGLPNNVPPISPVRKIAPSYIDVNERHSLAEFTVRHNIKDTLLELTLFRDDTNNMDTRNVVRFPGEARPFPTPPSTQLVPALQMNNQVIIAEMEGQDTHINGVNGKVESKLNEQFTLTVAGSYELIIADMMGDRPLITSTPTASGVVPVSTNNYQNLVGESKVKDYIGKIDLEYAPSKDFRAKLGYRYQEEYINGSSSYTVVSASGTPATTVASSPRTGWAKIEQTAGTPVVELRYTGLKDFNFYFTGSLRDLSGTERNTSAYNPTTAVIGTAANNNLDEDHGNYTLGAGWKQSSFLTLRAEIFQKSHGYEVNGFGAQTGDHYFLDNLFRGAKLTAIINPMPTLSLTSRYVYQKGEGQVTGYLPAFPAYDSLDSEYHMFTQNVDWSPNKSCYMQVNATAVFSVLSTVYPRAGTTPASGTNIAFSSNGVLQNSNNDYVTGSVVAGWVLDKNTDLQAQYVYYNASNGDAYLANLTQPYGADFQDQMITVGVKHRLNEKTIIHAKLGYVDSKNDRLGGFSDFKGPMAYVTIDRAL